MLHIGRIVDAPAVDHFLEAVGHQIDLGAKIHTVGVSQRSHVGDVTKFIGDGLLSKAAAAQILSVGAPPSLMKMPANRDTRCQGSR